MKCKHCGCTARYFQRSYTKNVVTLKGKKKVKRDVYTCKGCSKAGTEGKEVAPKGMRIGYDVIKEVCRFLDMGCLMREAQEMLYMKHKVKVCMSSIAKIRREFWNPPYEKGIRRGIN